MLMRNGGFNYACSIPGWLEDTLIIPMRNDQGNILELVAPENLKYPNHPVSFFPISDVRRTSPRRWMRMVFQAADARQIADSHATTSENEYALLTDYAWDAIQLWQAGFPGVLAPGIDPGWANIRQFRSAAKLSRWLIYAAPMRDICSERFERLVNHLATVPVRLEVAVLPDGYPAAGFVQAHGAKAFSALLENAVPAIKMLPNGGMV